MYDAVGATFLSQDTKKFCLNKRSKRVSNSGTWSFWGGKVERGETVIGALKREIKEEVGFVPEIIKIHHLISIIVQMVILCITLLLLLHQLNLNLN